MNKNIIQVWYKKGFNIIYVEVLYNIKYFILQSLKTSSRNMMQYQIYFIWSKNILKKTSKLLKQLNEYYKIEAYKRI